MRVAIVGLGYYAQNHLAAWRRVPGVELVAVCDKDFERARIAAATVPGVQAFEDACAMVAACRPDIVDLVTPEATHALLLNQMVGLVRTIVCQKPLAPSFAQAQSMIAIARDAGCQLLVHENFRFQPWFQELRQIILSNEFGAVSQLTFRFRPGDGRGPNAYLDRQPYFRGASRFFVHETGIHYIDTFRFLLGEVKNVTARLRKVNPAIKGEDAALVIFEFGTGAFAVLDANRDLDHQAQDCRLTGGEMLVEFLDGAVRLDGLGRLWQRSRGQSSDHLRWQCPLPRPSEESAFAYIEALMRRMCAGQSLAPFSAQSYLRNIEIEEAVYLSSLERRTVNLQPGAFGTVQA